MYKLICMTFDGDYITEKPEFETIEQVWNYADDLGSKWFFYPFYFVVSESLKTIIDSPPMLEAFNRKRVSTVQRTFKKLSDDPDMKDADPDKFAFTLSFYHYQH